MKAITTMTSVIWNGDNFALVCLCAGVGLAAFLFFVGIFVADAQDARRRSQAKKAFRQAQKHYSANPPPSKTARAR